jgi:glycosyltransferase involved in cell wall biosynthesis/Tfp pilus assembly protein PilF
MRIEKRIDRAEKQTLSSLRRSTGFHILSDFFSWTSKGPGRQDFARMQTRAADRARDVKNWSIAAAHYSMALQRDPDQPAIWVQYGHALKESGNATAAEAAYLEAARMKPTVADTYLQLGHLMKVMRQLDRARGYYQRATEIDPNQQDAIRELASLPPALEGGDSEQRGKIVQELTHHVISLFESARAAGKSGNWKAAAAQCALALELNPASSDVWPVYGKALIEIGEYALAEDAYLQALRFDVNTPDNLVQLGRIMQRLGRAGEATRYFMSALKWDPKNADAKSELDSRTLGSDDSSTADGDMSADQGAERHGQYFVSPMDVVFDVTDLLQYFRGSRLPTGIQRVQIEVISAFAMMAIPDLNLGICCFLPEDSVWLEVPLRLFARLSILAVRDGDPLAAEWVAALDELDQYLKAGVTFKFPFGAYLVNLGTSWWLKNYFLNIRLAKEKANIKYIPFVHDLIPVVTPEHCDPNLVREFIGWTLGIYQHAEYFLANSQQTRADLISVAETLGQRVRDVHVIPLAADFRKHQGENQLADGPVSLAKFGLDQEPFVLFVSTIESRKNHNLVFSAWLRMIRKRGVDRVPRLVCIGKYGWIYEQAMAKFNGSEALKNKVTILSSVSDIDLRAFYNKCLFTVFPSFYEGWGLPVTEALCYGKVPLISRIASLPEAGGEFAEYFELDSEAEFVRKAERLIDDEPYRIDREALIRSQFRPRLWREIAADVLQALVRWKEKENDGAEKPAKAMEPPPGIPSLAQGKYYTFGSNRALSISPGLVSGEAYRHGQGWWWPDDWGTWTRGSSVRIAFKIDRSQTAKRIYVGLRGLPTREIKYRVGINDLGRWQGRLGAREVRWVTATFVPASGVGAYAVQVTISSEEIENLQDITGGADQRMVSIGLIGFMVCEETDVSSRLNLLETISLAGSDPPFAG